MTDPFAFQCPCGKQYSVSTHLVGREFLCSSCNQKIRVPGQAPNNPVPADSTPAVSIPAVSKESKFDWRLLGAGILFFIGGLVAVSMTFFSWTRSGRVRLGLPIVGVVLVVMGLGSIIKAIGGDAIEWD